MNRLFTITLCSVALLSCGASLAMTYRTVGDTKGHRTASVVTAASIYDVDRLIRAAERGNVEHVLTCLRHGVDVNGHAGPHSVTALTKAARHGRITVVQALLSRPEIYVNDYDARGRTALMLAAKKGHLDVVQALLSRPDIDVNMHDDRMSTALIMAVKAGHTEVVQALVSHPHINVNEPGKHGQTALSFNYHNKEIEKLLREHGAVDAQHSYSWWHQEA